MTSVPTLCVTEYNKHIHSKDFKHNSIHTRRKEEKKCIVFLHIFMQQIYSHARLFACPKRFL